MGAVGIWTFCWLSLMMFYLKSFLEGVQIKKQINGKGKFSGGTGLVQISFLSPPPGWGRGEALFGRKSKGLWERHTCSRFVDLTRLVFEGSRGVAKIVTTE